MIEQETSRKYLKVVKDSKFIKPKYSDFECRFEKFENGLDAFLISSEQLTNASVNLLVRVGSAYEGHEINGLAHFLEHLLFLGTEKFPGPNEFGRFVRTHGGSTNASTEALMTHFSFSIPDMFLEQALEIFCEFFKSPLLSQEHIWSEINIIESEFLSKTNNYYTLLEHVFKQLADDSHIYSKFFYGNSESLRSCPEEMGLSLRDKLVRFFDDYYGSENMTLIIMSKSSIRTLSELAYTYFSKIRSCAKTPPPPESLSLNPGFPYSGLSKRLVKVHLNANRNELMFIFPLPMKEYGLSRAFSNYLSFFLTSGLGEGLLDDIVQKGLCTHISLSDTYNQMGFSQVTIAIDLTQEGVENMGEVIMSLFSALHMIRQTNLVEEYVKRIVDLHYNKFLKVEESLPSMQLSELFKVYYMTNTAPEKLFSTYYCIPPLTSEVFEEFMRYLTTDMVVAILMGSDVDPEDLIRQDIIRCSNHDIYRSKRYRVRDFITYFVRPTNIAGIEDKYLLSERYFKTNYSIWDFSDQFLTSIADIKVGPIVDFSRLPLQLQTMSIFESVSFCHPVKRNCGPPLLLDIAYEIEKLQRDSEHSLMLTNRLKVSSVWRGLFFIRVPTYAITSYFLVLRLVIPPLFGKLSLDQFSNSGFYVKNIYHSYVLVQMLVHLIKENLDLNLGASRMDRMSLQVYPTFQSLFPSFGVGVECYLSGQMDTLPGHLNNFLKALRDVSQLREQVLETAKSAVTGKRKLEEGQLKYIDLIGRAESEVLSTEHISTDRFIKLTRKIKVSDMVEFSKFIQRSCLFEGFFGCNTSPVVVKPILDEFVSNIRGMTHSEISRPLLYIDNNTSENNCYQKPYYRKIFFEQNQESYPYQKREPYHNGFDQIDLFSIPPDRNRLYHLSRSVHSQHDLIRLSVFFKKEDPITLFKLQIVNQVFFDVLFERIRQKRQVAYEFDSQVRQVSENAFSYSFVIQNDNHSLDCSTYALLECLDELSPQIINQELFKVVLSEKIGYLEKGDTVGAEINSLIMNTFNRTFDYYTRKDILERLRSLTFLQFQNWLSRSLNNAPVLITACISERASELDKKKNRRFVPFGFTRIKRPTDLLTIDKVKSFHIHRRIFN